MKKLTVLFLMFAAAFTMANSAQAECRFSKNAAERTEVVSKGCAMKLCSHAVVCDGVPSLVGCPAKSGQCDGYDANECVAQSALISEEAKFVATDFVPQSTAPAAGAGSGMGGR
ncbi:hypothetical protein BH10BDE1_BH10BDE1_22950 [soil metagenome]